MQWIKVLLVAGAVLLLIYFFRNRQRVELRAGTRVLAVILVGAAVASIIDPNIPQRVAEWLGVARGTDLLLYLLIVVFVFTTLGFYFRMREADHRLRILARRMAIESALHARDLTGLPPTGPESTKKADS